MSRHVHPTERILLKDVWCLLLESPLADMTCSVVTIAYNYTASTGLLCSWNGKKLFDYRGTSERTLSFLSSGTNNVHCWVDLFLQW